jgi:hypothetical protein
MREINPLLINLRRAQEYRYIKNQDQLNITSIGLLQDNRHSEAIQSIETENPGFQSSQILRLPEQFNTKVSVTRDINIRWIASNNNTNSSPEHRLQRQLKSDISQIVQAVSDSGNPGGQPSQFRVFDTVQNEELVSETRNRRRHEAGSTENTIARVRILNVNGTIISFTNNDVQWPVGVVSFSEDIRRSLREWDDDPRVKLKGISVPVRLWATLFKNIRPARSWDTIKKAYSELKV